MTSSTGTTSPSFASTAASEIYPLPFLFSEAAQKMLLEYISQVAERLKNHYPEIKFGMIDTDKALII